MPQSRNQRINNGNSTSAWFDRWADVCPLKDMFSNKDIARSGFSLDDSQKLKTQDRLQQWDVRPSIDLNLLKCPMCDLVLDSHDHLFFECAFSSQVWYKVRVLCGMDSIPPRFIDVSTFIIPMSKGKTAVSILSRLVVAATSYYIWLERNGRLFKKKTSSPDQIFDVILSMVRLKLVTFKFKKMSTQSCLLLDQWKIPSYCIVHDGSSNTNDKDADEVPDKGDDDVSQRNGQEKEGRASNKEKLTACAVKFGTLVNLPNGKRAIGTKWVFRNNKDEGGVVIRNKARLVAQCYTQEEGINYDEIFAPVARIYAQLQGRCVMDDISLDASGVNIRKEGIKFDAQKIPDEFYGGTHFLLRIASTIEGDGIFISQDKYVAEILKKFDFATVKTASTPMEPNKALVKDEEADSVMFIYTDQMNLLISRLSISVHIDYTLLNSVLPPVIARPAPPDARTPYRVPPDLHILYYTIWNAVKRIFRYLKGQPKLGLWYPRDSSFDLDSLFQDVVLIGAILTGNPTNWIERLSISLARRLISWQCKKQTIVANSTTEAEYVAAANCYGQCCSRVFKDGFDGCIELKMLFGPVLRVKHGKKLVSAARLALCCWAKVSTVRHRVSAARQT
ncbi:reverse transcriptase domain, reverse transcriptase zinc-binding domain protein [Tanacetum coccineum]